MEEKLSKTGKNASPCEKDPPVNACRRPFPGTTFLLLAILFLSLAVYGTAGALERDGHLFIPILKVSTNDSGKHALEGWRVREWKGKADIEVVDSEIGKALHLKSNSTSTALYRDVSFDIKKYQILSWKWMATTLPAGADVRNKAADDQAVQLYVIFPYKWPASINSRLIGYIWDTNAPKGAVITSAKSKNVKYIVLKSGHTGLGQWFTEKRNLYEDYKRLFNEDPPDAAAISVMIDSDDTGSAAESFIGDITLARKTALSN